LYPDEVRHVLPALSFVEGGLPTNAVPGTGPGLSIGDHELSAMTVSYVGSLKPIAFVPVAALFDISAASVRYLAIAVAALALLATYTFARRLFRNEAVALVALALLALDPGFIFYVRHDFDTTAFMMLATAVAGWQLLRWWDTGGTASLVLGSLALGVGLYDKFTFIWVICALAGATAIVAGRAVWRRVNLRTLLIAAAAFLVGCSPLVVYNLRSNFGTLHGYEEISGKTTGADAFPYDERVVPSGSFPSQLAQRVRVLGDLLDGSTASRMVESPFPHHFEIVPLLVALGALAICVQLVLLRPPSRELRAGAFALLAALLVLIAAAATHPAFHGHHVILAYPFPHLALALVLVQAGRLLAHAASPPRRRAILVSLVTVLAAIPVTFSAITTAGMFDTFSQTGGRGVWSDGIYGLERYLARQHGKEPLVTVDWGLAAELVALSQGHLHVNEVAFTLENPESRSQPVALVSKPLRDRRTWYVLRSPQATAYRLARERFFAAVESLHGRPTLVRRLDDREGRPLFEIYSAEAVADES
jgi:hypothetical protein